MSRSLLNGAYYVVLDEVYRDTTVPIKKKNIKKILQFRAAVRKRLTPLFAKRLSQFVGVLNE